MEHWRIGEEKVILFSMTQRALRRVSLYQAQNFRPSPEFRGT